MASKMETIANLRRYIQTLKSRERTYKQKIDAQRADIEDLRAALRVFLDRDRESPESDHREISENIEGSDEAERGQDAEMVYSEDNMLPTGNWDDVECVYRCNECGCELQDGLCHRCGIEYRWDDDDENLQNIDSILIDNEALASERCLEPRGATPILDVGSDIVIPKEYSSRIEEYRSLLERGASRLMCETFHMEYTFEQGIVAWADGDIYDTFAGPAMQKGDFWKIHLGRFIKLDDDDYDGSQFLEGLLEDILLFPIQPCWTGQGIQWETVEESPGLWATRPWRAREIVDHEGLDSEDDLSDIYGHLYYDSGSENEDNRDDVYADHGARIPTNIHGHPDSQRLYDAALEYPYRPQAGPVVQVDEYEPDGPDQQMEDDPDWTIQAHMPDAVYENDEDSSEEGQGAEESDAVDIGDAMSEAGSDFDSDEVLSGDEEILSCR